MHPHRSHQSFDRLTLHSWGFQPQPRAQITSRATSRPTNKPSARAPIRCAARAARARHVGAAVRTGVVAGSGRHAPAFSSAYTGTDTPAPTPFVCVSQRRRLLS
jgi:hypothetical protein